MEFYILLFIAVVVPFLLFKNSTTSNKVSFFIIWFVYAFRDNLAVDDSAYIVAYENVNKGFSHAIELTYKLISKLAFNLNLNYKFVFLVYATISFVLIYKITEKLFNTKFEKILFLTTFLAYEFSATISIMRQFLSASLIFYGSYYFYNGRNIIRTTFVYILALLFHEGAILALPFIFVFSNKFRLSYKRKIVLLILCVIIGYLSVPSFFIKELLLLISTDYKIYINDISGSFSSSGGTITWLMMMVFIFQCIISIRSKNKYPNSRVIDFLEKGQLLYLGILFLLINAGVANRLSFTFILFASTLPITLLYRFVKKDRFILTILIVLFMFALYTLTMKDLLDFNIGNFFPYNFSFDFMLVSDL